jgi:hypothetical protein
MGSIEDKEFQVDRKAFSVGSLDQDSDEKEYWKTKSPIERLRAIEMMRQIIYGYRGSAPRLQRFFEVAKYKAG